MTALLEIEGSKVIHVATGAAAIPAIEGAEIHLVILDVGLPDLDGTVVYERIAGRWPHLPVIFSTGHSGRARLERYLQAPNVGFLQKPYDFPSLASVCSQLRVRMLV
jgi:CheY-like chemotaxis protein